MTEERLKAFLLGLDIPHQDWHPRLIGVGGPLKGMPVGVRPKDNALYRPSGPHKGEQS